MLRSLLQSSGHTWTAPLSPGHCGKHCDSGWGAQIPGWWQVPPLTRSTGAGMGGSRSINYRRHREDACSGGAAPGTGG